MGFKYTSFVTEPFTGSNGTDLGANWTPVSNSMHLNGNAARPASVDNFCSERWDGRIWHESHYAEVTVVNATLIQNGSFKGAGVIVNSVGSGDYFFAVINAALFAIHFADINFASAGTITSVAFTPQAGDRVRLETRRLGSTVELVATVKRSGSVVATLGPVYADSALDGAAPIPVDNKGGGPGIYSNVAATDSVDDGKVDDFEAGEITDSNGIFGAGFDAWGDAAWGEELVQGGQIQNGEGAIAGLATVTGAGKIIAAGAGTAAGAATSAAVGTAVRFGAGAIAGSSTATAAGTVVKFGAGAAAGQATVSGAGLKTSFGQAAAAGAASTAAAGRLIASAAGTSSGSSTSTAAGQAVRFAAASAAGAATATAGGTRTCFGGGSAGGSCDSDGLALRVRFATGAAAGSSSATAEAEEEGPTFGDGISSGAAVVVGVGLRTSFGRATSDGGATVSGVGVVTRYAAGQAVGSSEASAVGTVIPPPAPPVILTTPRRSPPLIGNRLRERAAFRTMIRN